MWSIPRVAAHVSGDCVIVEKVPHGHFLVGRNVKFMYFLLYFYVTSEP